MRPISRVAPDWWDYTTLDPEILTDAARLKADDLPGLAREGFDIRLYDTLEDFYLAEALEYITAWRQATADNPTGICGPIGPTEQLPLVARLVNELELDLRHAHFWGMDEWAIDGREVTEDFPLSFARADKELVLQPHRAEAADARRQPALSHRPAGRYTPIVRLGPLPGDAGRAGRSEALGVQRSAEARAANTSTLPPRRPNIASWPRGWSICIR